MKEKKIIIILIFIILILISIILNLINKGTVNNQKQIIKRMSSQEYENSITALNESQIAYANSIEQSKINLANAITAKGVTTATDASFSTMVTNIQSIKTATTHTETKDIINNDTIDLGVNHSYRYIKTNVPHPTHTTTKTINSNGTTDLGAINSVRYITTNIPVVPKMTKIAVNPTYNYLYVYYDNSVSKLSRMTITRSGGATLREYGGSGISQISDGVFNIQNATTFYVLFDYGYGPLDGTINFS